MVRGNEEKTKAYLQIWTCEDRWEEGVDGLNFPKRIANCLNDLWLVVWVVENFEIECSFSFRFEKTFLHFYAVLMIRKILAFWIRNRKNMQIHGSGSKG